MDSALRLTLPPILSAPILSAPILSFLSANSAAYLSTPFPDYAITYLHDPNHILILRINPILAYYLSSYFYPTHFQRSSSFFHIVTNLTPKMLHESSVVATLYLHTAKISVKTFVIKTASNFKSANFCLPSLEGRIQQPVLLRC